MRPAVVCQSPRSSQLFNLHPQSQWKAANNTHVQWASVGFIQIYFQTHSVYIFGGRHNIGHWICCQISVWQRHRITNNGLGERYGPRFPGSTKTKPRKQNSSSAAILSRTHESDEHFAGDRTAAIVFSEWFRSHFLTFFPFTPDWLLSSLKEERNRLVYHGRRTIPCHKGQWEI